MYIKVRSQLHNTYMRVQREVQVFSELGYRGATPVLKHMQVGLALVLPTHNHITNASHFIVDRLIWQKGFSWSTLSINPLLTRQCRGILSETRPSWARAGDRKLVRSVRAKCEPSSTLSELILCSWSDISLNYIGETQDTARTDGETSLPWARVSSDTHTDTHGFVDICETMALWWLVCRPFAASEEF